MSWYWAYVRGFRVSEGKVFALLWQIFLVSGVVLVRKVCNQVRAIVSDMGTERGLPHADDVLRQVLIAQGCPPLRAPPHVGGKLFPRALHVRGWRHSWDLLVQHTLCASAWFPRFIARLRAVVSFIRDVSNLCEWARHLTALGRRAAAQAIRRISVVSIAEWRWLTLFDCIDVLNPLIDTLKLNFNGEWFKNTKYGTRLTLVIEAFSSHVWVMHFRFTHIYMSRIAYCTRWIATCRCHPDSDEPCFHRGRRLRDRGISSAGRLGLCSTGLILLQFRCSTATVSSFSQWGHW